jgi:hypothetical protein
MPHASDFHTARQQENILRRDAARLAIESCDYLLNLPNLERCSTLAVPTFDPVAVTHLHRFADAWGLTVVDRGDYLTLAGILGRTINGRDAKRYIESHRSRCEAKVNTATREIARGFARYGLPTRIPHAIDVVA